MTIDVVLPRLSEPAVLLCTALWTGDGKIYTVPVEHRRLGSPTEKSRRLLRQLPSQESFEQLRCILEDGPLGLFAPRLRPLSELPDSGGQLSWGAILILAPEEWAPARREWARWFFDGVDAAFAGLPYAFKDVLIFAQLNFSPDCWFTVLSGPMSGKVFWWNHESDADLARPWAQDIRGWAERVWNEVPEVFGGIIRFEPGDCADPAPAGAELYPESLR